MIYSVDDSDIFVYLFTWIFHGIQITMSTIWMMTLLNEVVRNSKTFEGRLIMGLRQLMWRTYYLGGSYRRIQRMQIFTILYVKDLIKD